MSRIKTDAISQSRQLWNQPAPFRIDFTWAGLKTECLKCRNGGRVCWTYLGFVQFAPHFRFECNECGNVAERRIFNSAGGFPTEPAPS
jgi:hypothetical protein